MKKLLIALAFTGILAAQSGPSVTLTWSWSQAAGGPASGYYIQRATVSGGPYTQIGTVTSLATLTYVDQSSTTNVLTPGTTYYYVVIAAGPGGSSPASNELAATMVAAPPVAPVLLHAVPAAN